ncbi:MAG: bifunctional DNA primase/polymerase, partial [Microthrixaceae bacterium]
MSAVPDHDPALTAALAYAARGWRVLPIKPGTKHPPIKAWQEAATTDAETIANWFTHLYRDHGVGIATGAASGVWVLDVDDWEALATLEEEHGRLPATYSVTTGSGGIHQYYAVPDGQTITNANQLPRGIDVRGEGGQVVAPPSMHPESGQAYTQEHSSPDALAQAPAWLLELVRAPERSEAPERPTTPPVDAGHRPGDIWAATTSWADILKPDGWQFAYTDPGGTEMWVRPGKEMREGVSASVGHKGSDVLKVFTSSLEGMGLSEGETYTKIGYLAATRHSGDHSAAAAWLASQGHREDEGQVIADMIGTFPEGEAPVIDLPPLQLDDGDDDWSPIDLVSIAREIEAGEREREVPTILAVEGHLPLIYRARIGSLFGTPGGGKTWVALHALAEQLKAGEIVGLIDWEDSADGTVARLLALGVTPDQMARFIYFSVATALPADLDRILVHLGKAALVVLDSAGEAMGAAGIDPNADGPVAAWMARVKLLTRSEARTAVLLLDHVPKDKEAPSGFAIGSQRKLAAVTGAAYRLETVVEPARGKPGKLRLIVAKDRLGNRAKGTTAAEVHIEPGEGEQVNISLTVSEAQLATERGEVFRPTHLMERVSRFVEDYPECSTRTIREHIKGKGEAVKQAIEVLVAEGYI